MKKFLLLIIACIAAYGNTYATHNRAGEITYQHISGKTYKIIVTTYTNTDPNSTQADRCELVVYFGDGDSATAPRINGPSNQCVFEADGVSIAQFTKKSIYETTHTYPGNGNYIISMEDPNRNAGICNIPNSVDQSFFLVTELVINPWLGLNSSPALLNPPIDEACVGVCFEHNPGAFDADGDSLSYSLTTCYANGAPILGYVLPPAMTLDDIDPLSGDLVWCAPPMICQYNIAILIKEYRRSPYDNNWYYIGSVLRDMQIDVASCSNTPPDIADIPDTCIVAGSNLSFTVTAVDAQANVVSLTATGGPFQIIPTATFISTPAISTATGQFSWTPNCSQIQLLPYMVTFKATDNNSPPLADFESVFIKVVPAPPTNLTATPNGASMVLNWNATTCNDTLGTNPLLGYQVYRKNNCAPWVHDPCQTGVPSYTGYTLIGSALPSVLTFTDNNNNQGLINGVDYSYIIVAYYADGSQSFASTSICARLVRDVPIITNVSVISTGTSDSIWVHWIKPVASDLDTIANPPPYEYRLMQATGFNPPATSFAQVSSYTQPAYALLTDSSYIAPGLNTQDSAYTYRVDFYSNGLFKGSTSNASSVFLTSTPGDEQVTLSWQEFVPWINYKYHIYRANPVGSNNYVIIDSSLAPSYLDTGLVNGINYCYKIVSKGEYSDTTIIRPLYNRSQIKCDVPVDIVPPCQPVLSVDNNCDLYQNVLSWTNPNNSCSNDAIQYTIYFSPTLDGVPELIYTSTDINQTTYTHVYQYEGVPSVAGCYVITALDSTGNESPMLNKVCVDNCPEYGLPNVFTPNGDGFNDLFNSLPYRYIKDVDFKVYDRWGLLMFETTNPDVLWDGKNTSTKTPCTDATYFYVCTVNEIRLEGVTPRVLKGFIQLLQQKNKPSN